MIESLSAPTDRCTVCESTLPAATRLIDYSAQASAWSAAEARYLTSVAKLLKRTGARTLGHALRRGLVTEQQIDDLHVAAHSR